MHYVQVDLRLYQDNALLYGNAHTWNCEIFKLARPLFIEGTQIPQVCQMKRLGTIFDSSLKWDTHILNKCGKSKKLLSMIQHSMVSTNPKTKQMLFNGIVMPPLEYAGEVRSPHNKWVIIQLDMVHRRGITWIYHLESLDKVSQTTHQHQTTALESSRRASDLAFRGKIECCLHHLGLRDYFHFNTTDDTC